MDFGWLTGGMKMKEKVIIFGATDTGKRIYEDIRKTADVIAFLDEDEHKWNTELYGITISNPNELVKMKYDYIYVGVLTYYSQVLELLKKLQVPVEKIIGRYVEIPTYARIEYLKSVRILLDEDGVKNGAVAELGVYRGDFAKEINKVFYDRKCYLFDTFDGFSAADCKTELDKGYAKENRTGYFANTTEDIVLSKMQYPEQCQLCKGFFPKSVAGVEDDFCFVNLDADLYAPTLAGLEYFYPRMLKGGIILIHDYFSKAFLGAKDAVKEFCKREHISYLPIGDTLSVAIRK